MKVASGMAIPTDPSGTSTASRFQQDTPRSKLSWWKARTRTSSWTTLEETVRRIYKTQATPLYYGASGTSSSLGDKQRLVHHLLRLCHLLLRLLHRLLLLLQHRLHLRLRHRLLLRLLHRLLRKLLFRHLPSQGPPSSTACPHKGNEEGES